MLVEERYIPFLKGEERSLALKFELAKSDKTFFARDELITNIIQYKKVIHFGLLDHINFRDKKNLKGKWFHRQIEENAKECLGIDTNKEGVEYIKKKYSKKEIICADIINDDIERVSQTKWDYMVMGDVLGHKNNPLQFLSEIKRKYVGVIDRLIIAVPNGFSIANFLSMKKQHENIHSDSRFWFTPYTLCKIITISQMRVVNLFFCTSAAIPKRKIFKRKFLKKYPGLRDVILVVVDVGGLP